MDGLKCCVTTEGVGPCGCDVLDELWVVTVEGRRVLACGDHVSPLMLKHGLNPRDHLDHSSSGFLSEIVAEAEVTIRWPDLPRETVPQQEAA